MPQRQIDIEELEDYQKRVLQEELRDAFSILNGTRKLRLVEFVSMKNRRRPREVRLLIDESAAHGRVAYQIKEGEIRPRRNSRGLPPDILAKEVLSSLPPEDRTADELLQRILERARKIPLFK